MNQRATRSPRAVALVTGASSGIGRACAEELARTGLLVFGTSRRRRVRTNELFQMLTLDVRDDASVARCIQRVLSRAGRIDLLVNNAGVATIGALEETRLDEFRNVMDTNLFGTVRMMRAVLPIMRRQRQGRIVNMGSIMASLPMPYSSAYCASKHAMRGLSESVDHEVRGLGIRVITIEPGFVRTDIVQRSPVAASIGPYAAARAVPVRYFHEQIEQGADPALVARVVVEAATAAHPDIRYLPDTFARLVHFVRAVLPSSCFDFALRRYFRLDKSAQ
jgi:NAD(P)-dependent dehydrogenase (short-subunit alcohol dehydrogenase family)